MEVLPTILTDDENLARNQIERLKELVTWAHLDVIDGVFSEMKTVKPEVIFDSGLNWEIHLMVEEPVIWIERCLNVKAERIVGQIENMSDQNEFVETIMRADVEVGLALDLETEWGAISEEVLPWLNKLLIMGVKAGKSGQLFNESIYEKVKSIIQIRKIRGYSFRIEVDGGVNIEVATKLKELGVDCVAMNSVLWSGNFAENWGLVKSI